MAAISVCKYQENYLQFSQIRASLWNYLNSQDLQGEHPDTNFNNWLITFHLCAYLLSTSPNFQSIYHFMFTRLKHITLLDRDMLRCNSIGNIKFLSCYDTTLLKSHCFFFRFSSSIVFISAHIADKQNKAVLY